MLLAFLEMTLSIFRSRPSPIRFMSYEHSSIFTHGFSGTSKSFPSLLSFTYLSPCFSFVLALDGPAIIRSGTLVTQPPPSESPSSTSPSPPPSIVQNRFKDIADQVCDSYDPQVISSTSTSSSHNFRPPHRFSLRYLNIVDPVDSTNNLGISVSMKNSKVIQTILFHASQHLESFYAWTPVPLSSNPSRPQSQHFHPSSNPSMQIPRPAFGNSYNIAPGLSTSNPMSTVYPPSPFHPHTHTAPSFHHHHLQPFLPPNHFIHSNTSSQFHAGFPASSNSNSVGDLPSFVSVYFSQSFVAYQSLLQPNQSRPPVHRRSLTVPSNNPLEQINGEKQSRISPPKREHASSYSSNPVTATTSSSALDELSRALSETAKEFDNLDSDITLMWNSLRYIPSPSPCVTPHHHNPNTHRGGKEGGRKTTSSSISSLNLSVDIIAVPPDPLPHVISLKADHIEKLCSECEDCRKQSSLDEPHALIPVSSVPPAPVPVDNNVDNNISVVVPPPSPLPQLQGPHEDTDQLLQTPSTLFAPPSTPLPSPFEEKMKQSITSASVGPSLTQSTQSKTGISSFSPSHLMSSQKNCFPKIRIHLNVQDTPPRPLVPTSICQHFSCLFSSRSS